MSSKNHLAEEKTIVQIVHIDETGDSYYRMRWPGRDIVRWAPNWRVISLDSNAAERFEYCEKADLLFLFQSQDLDLIPVLQKRRAAGKKTIVEYNDNFYEPSVSSPVYEVWSSPILWAAYERFIKEADCLLVTGPGLYDLFSRQTQKPIYILKNHIPDEKLLPFESLWPETKKITLGWGGSMGHIPDLFAYLPVIRELIAEFPDLQLSVMGNEAIPNYLDISADRFHFTNWGSMRQYFQFLETLHIGFVPVLDTPYNHCRSDIKAVEMASRAALPVLPDSEVYQEFLKESKLAAYQSMRDAKEKLSALIKDRNKLKESAKRAYDYIALKRLGHQNKERFEICLNYMGDGASTWSGSQPKGYHEIRGTAQLIPPFRESLIQVQNLFNQKKRREGLDVLESAIQANPSHPELAIAHLKALRACQLRGVCEKALLYSKGFHRDLRFIIFAAETASTLGQKEMIWEEIVRTLDQSSKHALQYFQMPIVTSFVKELKDFRELALVGQKLKRFYPGSVLLRFELAKAHEFRGEKELASIEFSFVLQRMEENKQEKTVLETLNINEIRAFELALK